MTNARPEKKVISKLNSNAVNSGDIRFNECHDQYTAYLNDLLRPLEEAYKKWYPNAKYDTELELAIKSVLAKHKAGTGEVDEVKWPEKRRRISFMGEKDERLHLGTNYFNIHRGYRSVYHRKD